MATTDADLELLIAFDGEAVTLHFNPDSGAHAHLYMDIEGYELERICRDTDCSVLLPWEAEQDAAHEQDELRVQAEHEAYLASLDDGYTYLADFED